MNTVLKRSSLWKIGQLALTLIMVTGLLGAVTPAFAEGENPPDGAYPADELNLQNPGQSEIEYHAGTNLVSFLAAEPGHAFKQPVELAADASPETAARSFLSVYGNSFGIQDPSAQLSLMKEIPDENNHSIVRFQQVYQGVPILGGELVVNMDAAKSIKSVNGEIVPVTLENVSAVVDAAAAGQTALAEVAKKYELGEDALKVSDAALWIYNPIVFQPAERGKTSLVWRITVTPTEIRPIRELVLVDANDGSILLQFNQADTGKYINTYNLGGGTTYPGGSLVCTESDPSCSAGDADAQGAHTSAGATYDYYSTYLGRDSIDGYGMAINSYVHYGTGYENAFWDGAEMVYGDGYSQSPDVVGHEISHGVTEKTDNLFYYRESGAINESYSDVHGEFVEQLIVYPSTHYGRWEMGQGIPGGAIRSMADPTLFGDPDKISSANYYQGLGDNGGVHYNSGVNNKAAYLMTDGGSFNGYTVTGIGMAKVAHVYYYAQTHYLTSASNYIDLYYGLMNSCNVQVGSYGITTADCAQVMNAVNAVEMYLQPGVRSFDDTSSAMTYSAKGWTAYTGSCDSWYYCTYHLSNKKGSTVRVPFTGSRATIYFKPFTKNGGTMKVYLDKTSKLVGTISQGTLSSYSGQYHVGGFKYGNHTLILKHSSGKYVDLDSVLVNKPINTMPALPSGYYYYPTNPTILDYRGYWDIDSRVWSYKTGDTVTFTFTGNQIGLYFTSYYKDKTVGSFKITVDGKSYGSVSEKAYASGNYVTTLKKNLAYKQHTVTIKHLSGKYVNFYGFAGYSPTADAEARNGLKAGDGKAQDVNVIYLEEEK